jgi:hypothetical protein
LLGERRRSTTLDDDSLSTLTLEEKNIISSFDAPRNRDEDIRLDDWMILLIHSFASNHIWITFESHLNHERRSSRKRGAGSEELENLVLVVAN